MMFDAHAKLGRSGHFVMASGHHGDVWLDLELVFNDPATLQPMIVALGRRLARYTPDTVCGPLSGGALLAYAIAQRFGWQFLFTEPRTTPHASSFAVPAALIPRLAGRRIAIVDDAINAGSALEATYADLCRHGATCVGIGTLFALGSAPAKAAAAIANGISVTHPQQPLDAGRMPALPKRRPARRLTGVVPLLAMERPSPGSKDCG